ncbi:MAG: endolytic transglycosylase MltG [Proteobacteria bacterium]|nr:MAG: endolytic transglycosylase MltG [Pseudomonadota bacterium]
MTARGGQGVVSPPGGCRNRESGFSLIVGLLVMLLAGAIVATALLLYVRHQLTKPLSPGNDLYTIERGQSLRSVARMLKAHGVIDEIYSLQVYARATGVSGRIKAGQYRFENGIDQFGILEKIVAGDVVRYQVQFIEGWTFAQMREALYSHPELDHRTIDLTGAEIMANLGFPDEHPEGRCFPDTYVFIAGDSALGILSRAHDAMARVLDEAWSNRADNLPISTPYEALILASIVEKETGLPSERELISGVFVNRLRKRMRLQTDPTVIYGLADRYDGNITRRHLREDNPYNTYTRRGLPPTPIAMPGREAILAAVRPEVTEYLYFVARGDGSHQFSVSLEQHNSAVRKFQLKIGSGG